MYSEIPKGLVIIRVLPYWLWRELLEAAGAGAHQDHLVLPDVGAVHVPLSCRESPQHAAGDPEWRARGGTYGANCRLPLSGQPQVLLLRLQAPHQVRRLSSLGKSRSDLLLHSDTVNPEH